MPKFHGESFKFVGGYQTMKFIRLIISPLKFPVKHVVLDLVLALHKMIA